MRVTLSAAICGSAHAMTAFAPRAVQALPALYPTNSCRQCRNFNLSVFTFPLVMCPNIDSPAFWHPVRCKLRLHFARLFAVWGIEPVVLRAPGFSVEIAVAYGFGYVLELDVLATFKVGNGAGNLEYAVICACREVEPCHRSL